MTQEVERKGSEEKLMIGDDVASHCQHPRTLHPLTSSAFRFAGVQN